MKHSGSTYFCKDGFDCRAIIYPALPNEECVSVLFMGESISVHFKVPNSLKDFCLKHNITLEDKRNVKE